MRIYLQLSRRVASLNQYVHSVMLCIMLGQLTGCATAAMRQTPKVSLEFLQDGLISEEEVILKLGSSFKTFERERILSYRLGKTRDGYFVIDRIVDPNLYYGSSWLNRLEGKFNLVLVFDERAILQRHSLVPID